MSTVMENYKSVLRQMDDFVLAKPPVRHLSVRDRVRFWSFCISWGGPRYPYIQMLCFQIQEEVKGLVITDNQLRQWMTVFDKCCDDGLAKSTSGFSIAFV